MSLFAAALLLGIGLPAAATGTVLVGVLEHPQCVEEPDRVVRALFAKEGDDWFALSTEEASRRVSFEGLEWTVAFDGRRLGSIRTTDPGFTTPDPWTYPRDRHLVIVKGQRVPTIRNKGGSFAGWCDTPSDRPLVVVSPAHFHDPQSWKPAPARSASRTELFSAFAAARGPAHRCFDAAGEERTPWPYTPSDLTVTATYRNVAGTMLVALTLDAKERTCDGPRDGLDATHWFVVADTVRHLGGGLTLVDAGDYDGDGRSELLFWYGAYDNDGYTLFYDGFEKRADFRWSYH